MCTYEVLCMYATFSFIYDFIHFLFMPPMINALSKLGISSTGEGLLQGLFVLFSIVLTIYVSLFYYRKMVDSLFREIKTENIFRKSILLALLNCIPKTLLILTNIRSGIDDNGALTNGMTILNITLCLPLIILRCPKKCYINHNSFIKDFLFLELSFLHQFSGLNTLVLPPLFVEFVVLTIFIFFLASTFKLPESMARDSLSNLTGIARLEFLTDFFKRSFKHIYDILILDLERVHKFSGTLNWRVLVSPIVNTFILIAYNGLWMDDRKILVSFLTAFIFGIILMKASKNTNLISIVYLYGVSASILHVYIFFSSYISIINSLSQKLNLNINYLRTVALPLLLSFMELFTLLYYSSIGYSTLAICSLIYSTIYNMMFLKPLINIIALRTNSTYVNELVNCNEFCYAFGIITSLVIMFNYVVRNQRITKDLSYNLLFTYIFFQVSLLCDFKKHVLN